MDQSRVSVLGRFLINDIPVIRSIYDLKLKFVFQNFSCTIIILETVRSSITSCSDPGLTVTHYGNGLIQLNQKSFCLNGDCEDLTVCQVVENGQIKDYVPMRGVPPVNNSVNNSVNKSKEKVIN